MPTILKSPAFQMCRIFIEPEHLLHAMYYGKDIAVLQNTVPAEAGFTQLQR